MKKDREFLFGQLPGWHLPGMKQPLWRRLVSGEVKSHFLCVGASRSGKGTGSIATNLLHYCGSAIVYDPKLENTWITAEYRARVLGQRVIILDPHGELKRQYADKSGGPPFPLEWVTDFNPLLEVDPGGDDYHDTLTKIADALVDRPAAQKDPHWDDRAVELLIGLMADCIESGVPSMTALRHRLMAGSAGFMNFLSRAHHRAMELGPRQKSAFYLLANFEDGKGELTKEVESIFSTARKHTYFIESPAMERHFNRRTNSFRLDELTKQPFTLYLGLPPDKLDAHYPRWVRMLLILIIQAVLRARPRDRVLFIMDEFCTALGRMPIVERLFGLGAGLGLILAPYVQSLSQLRQTYGEGWETLLGNASHKQFMSCGDQFTLEYVSRQLGAYRRLAMSHNLGSGGQRSTGFSETLDQVMRPEEVRRFLASGNTLLFADETPHRLKPLIYFKDPLFTGRFRPRPEDLPAVSRQQQMPSAPLLLPSPTKDDAAA